MKGMTMPVTAVYEKQGKSADLRRKVWIATAFVGAFSGMTAGVAGLFFMILTIFEPSPLHSRLGGFLLMAIFPLFILAAHSLDKIDAAERAEKLEKLKNYREKYIAARDCQ